MSSDKGLRMKSKMLTKKRLVLFALIVALTVSAVGVIIKAAWRPKMVKEGRIENVRYLSWDYANTPYPDIAQQEYGIPEQFQSARVDFAKPSNTILDFEDGETIAFVHILDNVEIGKEYRIVYHEQYAQAQGNFYWSDNYYEVDSIEEI